MEKNVQQVVSVKAIIKQSKKKKNRKLRNKEERTSE